MENQLNVEALKKQNKLLKVMIACFILFIIVSSFTKTSKMPTNNFDEIVVKKLTLIDSTGVKRLEITTDLSNAPFAGEELKRNVPPNMAGIIFMNSNGDEVGGIAYGGNKNGEIGMNVIDYSGIPLEAIGIQRYQTPQSAGAQFVVMDNPNEELEFNADEFISEMKTNNKTGKQTKILQSQMIPRVNLGVENHNAALKILDKQGNDRIILEVNENNEAVFKILDAEGNVVHKYPQN